MCMLLVAECPDLVSSSHCEEKLFLPTIGYTRNEVEGIVFDACPGCRKMSSIPQGAFAARKVQHNMSKSAATTDEQISLSRKMGDKNLPHFQFPQVNKKFLEHPPAKYNSKMMNSIWGLYNRYSVHNLKKITEDKEAQGLGALSAPASGPMSVWESLLSSGHTY